MPEIKKTFLKGRMNKDLDERLLPNGEFRDALNIKVSTSDTSDIGTVQTLLSNVKIDDLVPNDFVCVGSISDEKTNTLYWLAKKENIDLILRYSKDDNSFNYVFVDIKANTGDAVLKFPNKTITGLNIIDDMLFFTDGVSEPKKINIGRSIDGTEQNPTLALQNHTKLVVRNVNTGQDVLEENITVIKKKPTKPPVFNITYTFDPGDATGSNKVSLFEKAFSRFALRYKYVDGEFSAFGPFTDVVFNPQYIANPQFGDADTQSFTVADAKQLNYTRKEPFNRSMVNKIDTIELYDFNAPDMPRDVVEVEILYKQENNPVIYSIISIDREDSDFSQNGFNEGNVNTVSSEYKGKYVITTENIYAALPENQFIRVYDNVPKAALAQEVTGNRIVYGNYFQNYDIVSGQYDHTADYVQRQTNATFDTTPLKSLKSLRNYQIGIVFGDKYGRETPVFTTKAAAVKVPWKNSSNDFNSSFNNALKVDYSVSSYPDWADYYKFYIKETSTEYYNLLMDRAYIPTSQDDINRNKPSDHLWLSFFSSDRNKLKEQDHIILKKVFDPASTSQVTVNNKYKVIDIKNEAPDSITYDMDVVFEQPGSNLTNTFVTGFDITHDDTKTIKINIVDFVNIGGVDFLSSDRTSDSSGEAPFLYTDYYISWTDQSAAGPTAGQTSKRYRIKTVSSDGSSFIVNLDNTIQNSDAIIASSTGVPDSNTLKNELVFTLERKQIRELDQFSGRFFAKIVFNNLSTLTQSAVAGSLITGITATSQMNVRYLVDEVDTNNSREFDNEIINSEITSAKTYTGAGENTLNGLTFASDISQTSSDWSSIIGGISDGVNEPDFFIDGLYYAASQSIFNTNVQFSGDMQAGYGTGVITNNGGNIYTCVVHSNKLTKPDQLPWRGKDDLANSIWNIAGVSNYNFYPYGKYTNTYDGGHIYIDNQNTIPAYNHSSFDSYDFITNRITPNGDFTPSNEEGTGDPPIGHSGAPRLQYHDLPSIDMDGLSYPVTDPNFGEYTRGSVSSHFYGAGGYIAPSVLPKFGFAPLDKDAYNQGSWDVIAYAENEEFQGYNFTPHRYFVVNAHGGSNRLPGANYTWPVVNFGEIWGDVGSNSSTGDYHSAVGVYAAANSQVNNEKKKDYQRKFMERYLTMGYKYCAWIGTGGPAIDPDQGKSWVKKAVNGLEAFVISTDSHTQYNKRWATDSSVFRFLHSSVPYSLPTWVSDDTYGNAGDEGKFYLHISFAGPGQDLTDVNFNLPADVSIEGPKALGNYLQGIHGGGVFTKSVRQARDDGADGFKDEPVPNNTTDGTTTYVSDTRTINCFFNTDINDPSFSQGDPAYSQVHQNQWDPTKTPFGDPVGRISSFIQNLQTPNSKFKFSNDPNAEQYTIKKCIVKRLYNHTPWRRRYKNNPNNATQDPYLDPYNIVNFNNHEDEVVGDSVEVAAVEWAKLKFGGGSNNQVAAALSNLEQKIQEFGSRSNRRVTYILELDKDPTAQTFNPLNGSNITAATPSSIQFFTNTVNFTSGLKTNFPAIWEKEPEENLDLDIYYEATKAIPLKLNTRNRELLSAVGSLVSHSSAALDPATYIQNWSNVAVANADDEQLITIFPAAPAGSIVTGDFLRFTSFDGSFVDCKVAASSNADYTTTFAIELLKPGEVVGLSWYNCFSFGNGLESNRIRDDFNQMQITNGARASAVLNEPYNEEHKKNGLIYSGIYNSISNVNNLNQFIQAEKITKDLNPTFGSIQKLFQRRVSLVAFCEDRVVSIVSNKDALFNADGNPQIISSSNVLGDATAFVGDYGISQNPESFAKDSYRAYFTDKARGAVLRLSMDGITPISQAGMHDYFRDTLPSATFLRGSYDEHNQDYNLSIIKSASSYNLLNNAYLDDGVEAEITSVELIDNGTFNNSTDTDYPLPLDYNANYSSSDNFVGIENATPQSITRIIKHEEIPQGYFGADLNGNAIPTTTIPEWYEIRYSNDPKWTLGGSVSAISKAQAIYGPPNPGVINMGLVDLNTFTQINTTGLDAYEGTGIFPAGLLATTTFVEWMSSSNSNSSADNGTKLDGTPYDSSEIYEVIGPPTSDANPRGATWFPGLTFVDPFGGFLTYDGSTNSIAVTANGAVFESNGLFGTAAVNTPLTGSSVSGSTIPVPANEILTQEVFSCPSVSYTNTSADNTITQVLNQPIVHGNYYMLDLVMDSPVPATQVSTDLTSHIAVYGHTSNAINSNFNNHVNKLTGQVGAYNFQLGRIVGDNSPEGNGFSGISIDPTMDINTDPSTIGFNADLYRNTTTGQEHPYYHSQFNYSGFAPGTHVIRCIFRAYNDSYNGTNALFNQLKINITNVELSSTSDYGNITSIRLIDLGNDNTSHYNMGNSLYYNERSKSNIGNSGQSTNLTRHLMMPPVQYIKNQSANFNSTNQDQVYLQNPNGVFQSNTWHQKSHFNFTFAGDEPYTQNHFETTLGAPSNREVMTSVAPDSGFSSNDGYVFSIDILPDQITGRYESGNDGVLCQILGGYLIPLGHIGFQCNLKDGVGRYRAIANFANANPDPLSGAFTIEHDPNFGNNFLPASTSTVEVLIAPSNNQRGDGNISILATGGGSTPYKFSFKNVSLSDLTSSTIVTPSIPSWVFVNNEVSIGNNVFDFNNNQLEISGVALNNNLIAEAQQTLSTDIPTGSRVRVSFNYEVNTSNQGGLQIMYINNSGTNGFLGYFNETGIGTYSETFDVNANFSLPLGSSLPSIILSPLNTFKIVPWSGFGVPQNTNPTDIIIDNIVLALEGDEQNVTISYSEDVKGWTSFKSFVYEDAISLSKKYYTFKYGGIFEHDVQTNGYNIFYGINYESEITAIINESPSIIKSFKTFGYEGTQAKVTAFEEISNFAGITGNANSTIDFKNLQNLSTKAGWFIKEGDIFTNIQDGFVDEFIEKESKWFNYVKGGLSTSTDEYVSKHTGDLSFQGIGLVDVIEELDSSGNVVNTVIAPQNTLPTSNTPTSGTQNQSSGPSNIY